jgi:fibronectin-binding autotransporter adhesin
MLIDRWNKCAGAVKRQIIRRRVSGAAIMAVTAMAGMPLANPASAVVGTWTNTSGGLWSGSNWSGGTPSASGDSALFNTLNISADTTVHLDAPMTVGSMEFGDTVPTNNWTLDSNGNAGTNILTLSGSGTPTITVDNMTATISAAMAGSQGLTITGTVSTNPGNKGTLVLSGANTFTGTTTVGGGIVNYQNGTAFGTNSPIILLPGNSPSASIQVQGGITGGTQTLTLTGTANGPMGGATGTLESVSGNNVYPGPLAFSGTSAYYISSDSGSNLNLSYNTSPISGSGSSGVTLLGGGNGTLAASLVTNPISKWGTGTWTLTGTNTYIGGTSLAGGTLVLNQSSSTPVMNSVSTLSLSAGTLSIVNASIAPSTETQTFRSAAITSGETFIVPSAAPGSNQIVNMGVMARTAANGAVDLTVTSGNATPGCINLNTNGIIGGWATVGGNSWAVSSSPAEAVNGWTNGASGSVITAASPLANGTQVAFTTLGLPGGLQATTAYYVVGSSGNTFQVAATPGGTFITLSGTSATTGNVITSGTISPLTAYTATNPTTGGFSTDNDVLTQSTTLTGSLAANTLNITDANNDILDLNGNVLAITPTSGGIMYSGGGNFTINATSGGSIQASGQSGTTGKELIVNVSGTGILTVNCPLVNIPSGSNTYTSGGALTKTGTGTLVLGTTAQTFNSTLNISAGTVQTALANVLPPNLVVLVSSGAKLDLNGFNQKIASLTGSITQNAGTVALGSGTLTLNASGSNSFLGNFTGTSSSTLVIDGNKGNANTVAMTVGGNNTGYQGTVDIKANSIFQVQNAAQGGPTVLSALGGVSGVTVEGAVVKDGNGNPVLDGNGLTTPLFALTTVAANRTATNSGASLELFPNVNYNDTTVTWPNFPVTIAGSGAGTLSGGGIRGALQFHGGNNQIFPGNITLSNTAIISAAPSSPFTTNLTHQTRIETLTGAISYTPPNVTPVPTADLYINAEDNVWSTSNMNPEVTQFNINGIISGISNLWIQNTSYNNNGFDPSISRTILNAPNTFGGTTHIGATFGNEGQGGVRLQLGNAMALQNSTLDLETGDNSGQGGLEFSTNSTSYTLGGLMGGSPVALADTSSNPIALSVGNNNQSTTYSGTFSGGGSLTKIGTGTLTLSGASNNYTGSGATTVTSGLLVASNGFASVGKGVITINGGGAILKNTSASTVFGLLSNGFNSGAWNGTTSIGGNPAINSSAAANDPNHLTAVGMLQSGSDVDLKYTYYGDADLSGHVDGTDYTLIDTGYAADQTYLSANPGGTALPYTGWQNGDFNYDGSIDGSDYSLMDNVFNQQSTAGFAAEIAAPAAQIAGGSAVPEPTSLGLLGIGAAGLLGRRRRVRHR